MKTVYITLIGCVTAFGIFFLMTDCAKHGEDEFTKRQYVSGTNTIQKYDVMMPGGDFHK